MKITERKCKQIVGGAAAAALLLSGVHLPGAALERGKSGYRISQCEDYQGANQ